MKITKSQLRRVIKEALTLDISVGDVVLTGKFKNTRTVEKDNYEESSKKPSAEPSTVILTKKRF